LVAQAFRDFVAALKRQGWSERGQGHTWYALKMIKEL
jgi:hypothetical protein